MKTHESKTGNAGVGGNKQDGKSQDTLGDLESIFEKMHSEGHREHHSNGGDKNVLITTQEGGITYNITIPQDDDGAEAEEGDAEKTVRISMPNLDDDGGEKTEVVSMPSLHDEDNTQSSQEVPMELEDSDGQQLKFIVDENGQFLQLDNHILTTDAEGNQILVQGTDQEQLQHLLQSVGVDGNQVLMLQGNGESMEQGQMILVQGADGESQLIDASMLQTEDGSLVLSQGEDGQTHLTTADGIPVSVSFSGEGGEGQITVTMASGHEEGQQIFLQQPMETSAEGQEALEGAPDVPAETEPAPTAEEVPETGVVTSTTDTVEAKEEEQAPAAPAEVVPETAPVAETSEEKPEVKDEAAPATEEAKSEEPAVEEAKAEEAPVAGAGGEEEKVRIRVGLSRK